MLNEPTNNEIMAKLECIHSVFEERFKGVNSRLDILNGQARKNTQFRLVHVGAYKVMGVLAALVVAGVGIWKSLLGGS